ncbi:MAG: response regulator transcription factor [Fimbriimonadaceae bacterium]|nr:response regulator transcription factor [Fimbriimonadaceae bacterium]QYK55239.1 MAG: response regulator transcription factor [Fimbriimonadaceae bacterium]
MVGGVCVHIVDDDPGVLDSLKFLLASEGIAVVGYRSAEEFLAEHKWAVPGCLILDLRMPGIGGDGLLERLAEEGDPPPIVVLTAFGTVGSAVSAMRHGAVEYLEKPCPSERLLTAVRAAIERDKVRLERAEARKRLADRLATLSLREHEVLQGLVRGLSTAQIAEELGLQPKSVEVYRSSILGKTKATSTLNLVTQLYANDPTLSSPLLDRTGDS